MQKNFQIIFLLSYFILIFLFYILLDYFNLDNFLNPKFLLNNLNEYIGDIYNFKLIFYFSLFTVLWSLFLGFGMLPTLLGGIIFPTYFGLFLVVVNKTIGSTILFVVFKYNFSNLTKKILSKFNKFNIKKKIYKNELFLLILIRLMPIPVQIADLAPVVINAKIRNFVFSKLIGTLLSHFFYFQAIGSFLHIYRENTDININDFIKDSNILISISLLFVFFVVTRFIYSKLKNKIFN